MSRLHSTLTLRSKMPPADWLPDPLKPLAAELDDVRAKYNTARKERQRLASRDAIRAAERADREARADATRAGNDDPGNVHEQQRVEDLATAVADEERYEAAQVSVMNELAAKIAEAAPSQRAAAVNDYEDARKRYLRAVAKAKDAYEQTLTAAGRVGYWIKVTDRDDPECNSPHVTAETTSLQLGRLVSLYSWRDIDSIVERNDRTLAKAVARAEQATADGLQATPDREAPQPQLRALAR